MELTVKKTQSFRWKDVGLYRDLNTKLPLSLLEEAADLFMDL